MVVMFSDQNARFFEKLFDHFTLQNYATRSV